MSTAAAVPTANTTSPSVPHIHITRFLRVPRERVFAAWTEPEQMKRWMGPENSTCLEAESDLRVGGRYRFVVRGTMPPREGEAAQERTFPVTGEYLEVRPPELVRYTWRGALSPGRGERCHPSPARRKRRHAARVAPRKGGDDRLCQQLQRRLEQRPRQIRSLRRALDRYLHARKHEGHGEQAVPFHFHTSAQR